MFSACRDPFIDRCTGHIAPCTHSGAGASESTSQEAAALQQDNRELLENIDQLGTLQSIRRIAVEELGLADPNTVIFVSED